MHGHGWFHSIGMVRAVWRNLLYLPVMCTGYMQNEQFPLVPPKRNLSIKSFFIASFKHECFWMKISSFSTHRPREHSITLIQQANRHIETRHMKFLLSSTGSSTAFTQRHDIEYIMAALPDGTVSVRIISLATSITYYPKKISIQFGTCFAMFPCTDYLIAHVKGIHA